jgi:hypothetical protein
VNSIRAKDAQGTVALVRVANLSREVGQQISAITLGTEPLAINLSEGCCVGWCETFEVGGDFRVGGAA